MKKWFLMIAVLMVGMVAVSSVQFQAQPGNGLPQSINNVPGKAPATIDKGYGQMPLTFIPNQGQMDRQVYFYLQGKDKSVYFTSSGLTYALAGQSSRWVVKLDFVGARADVKPESLEKSGTTVSYFKGKPEDWQTGLQTASKIIYRELWPGIDLVYYGTVNKLKYEFIVHPGADPAQIKLAYRGAESVKENSRGQLEVQTPAGSFSDDTPVAWQEIDGKQEPVTLKYALENRDSSIPQEAYAYGFSVGTYDKTQTLILDPAVLVYCGYIGGSGAEYGYGIAVDTSGCAYITGYTDSTETVFPVVVGPNNTYNGGLTDAFVAKVRADGTGLVYCGYIGGSDWDKGHGIAVDTSGCAFITGTTSSTETTFPVTVGPDLTHNGGADAFVAKVKADGTALDYCGYIGGSGNDCGYGIAVDTSGCAYITGYTWSTETTFPVTVGPDLTFNGADYDAFVTKVKAAGTALDYCGYIGGASYEEGYEIAVDSSDCAYITGYTFSTQTSFPVTVGPDLTNNNYNDAFVAKVKADGTGLSYCGYIGGTGEDKGYGIAVDSSSCAYISGWTNSTQTTFPVVGGPDLTQNGESDAFVAKVKADGTGLVYCGYIGGSSYDYSRGIAVDESSCAYISGVTRSTQTTFPVTVGPDLTFNGNSWDFDAFVAKINASGTTLDYCGYIGGSGYDYAETIALDSSGCAYITGATQSAETSFPVTVGPELIFDNGDEHNYDDAFVAKISWTYPDHTVNFAAGNGGSLTGITSQTVAHGGNCTAVEAVAHDGYEFVNWTGTGGFVTTTANPLTVTNVTADMTITAHFLFSCPAGWLPVEGLTNNMVVYGKAYNGNNLATSGDWIGAFGPGGVSDCRGAATVQSNGNYYLTVGSDTAPGETISFKLWPLPAGPSIDSSETIAFIADGVINGLPLHFGPRGQNIALVNGWNWISFDVLPADTSLSAVFAGLTGIIEQVKGQTQAAIYSGGNWIGDLTGMSGIADGIMYKVNANQDCAVTVSGPAIPFNQPLSLITGWNWAAYLPVFSQPLEEAVASIMDPVSQVKSQYRSVIKIGSSLYGDLTDMEPHKGYTVLMTAPGVLIYPYGAGILPEPPGGQTAGQDTSAVQSLPWPVMKGNLYNMVAYGKIFFEDKALAAPGYYLAVFGPNGEADCRSLSPVKTDGSYFSTILGNTNGEALNFKLLNSARQKTYDVAAAAVFRADDLKADLYLKARSIRLTAPSPGQALSVGSICTISWEAYEVDQVKIELFKAGRSLLTISPTVSAKTRSYSWMIPDRMLAGNDYQVRVLASDAAVKADDLSGTFSILPQAAIVVNAPNGNQVWQVARNYDITWGAGGINNIKIELYRGSVLNAVISENTPAPSGKWTWSIPVNQPLGTDYQIKISSLDPGLNLCDEGDGPFSIVAFKRTAGDFNHDGKSDLVWRYDGPGGYNCLWLVGTSPKRAAVKDPRLDPQAVIIPAETGLDNQVAGTGDFNQDGQEDILWRNQSNGNNTLWLMAGATYTGTAGLPAEPDPAWAICGTGDFNADGQIDILWRNSATGSNKVWLLSGIAKVGELKLPEFADPAWDISGTGDFNHDGYVDILWHNQATGSNRVWLMKGKKRLRIESLPAISAQEWDIAAVGDYDGNETVDILWRNRRDGRVRVWLMDGLARQSSRDLTQVTDPTWKIED